MEGAAAAAAEPEASLLRRWFPPSVFRERASAEVAARAYQQAAAASDGDGASWVQYNVGTACTSGGTERDGVRMPVRDFILASSRMRLADNEPVYLILSLLNPSLPLSRSLSTCILGTEFIVHLEFGKALTTAQAYCIPGAVTSPRDGNGLQTWRTVVWAIVAPAMSSGWSNVVYVSATRWTHRKTS